jgi:SPP1 gp7 family putative phage head morphogenesis protein
MRKTPKLTKRKQKWAKNRDVTLRGTRLAYNASQQAKYKEALRKLVQYMTDVTQYRVKKLFGGKIADTYFEKQEEAAAMDSSITSRAKQLMNELTKKFSQLFSSKATPIAEKMVNGASRVSKASLHRSLETLSGGLSLKTGLIPAGMEDVTRAIINENVQLITSIPEQYLHDVSGAVMRSITSGSGLQTLAPEIQKYSGQSYRRAKNIALDQTRKAYNFINKQRMQALGVKQFEWIHSGGGQKPRQSHIAMDGKIFSFDDLPVINQEQVDAGSESPVRGIPGQAINCMCTILPVYEFDESED